jgi:YidC/Oxa1 family membrane protein insertase
VERILEPLLIVVSAIMLFFHNLLVSAGVDKDSGWAWGPAIVGLVVVIRIILIPLFVKQIKAQRGLQMLQPEIKKIQDKYKGKTDPDSRQKLSQEMMALYKDTGTNPLSSCLPILAQAPVFFALFYVLNGIASLQTRGVLSQADVNSASEATILGAPIAATFLKAAQFDAPLAVRIVTAVMIVLMSASTFITQKQLMSKNMPASAMDNPFAQQQKILLYVFPLIFLVTGVNFPIGVLIYWLTTNVWTLCQQLYVIRRMPSPGSLAEQALNDRRRKKGLPAMDEIAGGESTAGTDSSPKPSSSKKAAPQARPETPGGAAAPPPARRQQPKRNSRDKRRRQARDERERPQPTS